MSTLTETTRRTDAPARRDRLWSFVQLPLAGALLASVVTVVSWAPRLPGEVANQWSAGEVTTVRPLAVTIASVAVPALAAWLLLALARVTSDSVKFGHRSTVGALAGLTLALTGALPLLVAPSLATGDPWSAPDPGVLPLIALGVVGLLVAVGVAIAAGRPGATGTPGTPGATGAPGAPGAPGTPGATDTRVPRGADTSRAPRTIGGAAAVGAALAVVVLAALTIAPWPLALVAGATAATAGAALRTLRRPSAP